ncbi:hypothetical protein KSP39_PZI013574 [Platanthera zijinensis]|uniref:Uncharacterized protein n=1 Tax=Platanthera zijinensis TaxID=2320716 RepID=A0AAP0BC03_9ASPA
MNMKDFLLGWDLVKDEDNRAIFMMLSDPTLTCWLEHMQPPTPSRLLVTELTKSSFITNYFDMFVLEYNHIHCACYFLGFFVLQSTETYHDCIVIMNFVYYDSINSQNMLVC